MSRAGRPPGVLVGVARLGDPVLGRIHLRELGPRTL
jgi:hypothetical protein